MPWSVILAFGPILIMSLITIVVVLPFGRYLPQDSRLIDFIVHVTVGAYNGAVIGAFVLFMLGAPPLISGVLGVALCYWWGTWIDRAVENHRIRRNEILRRTRENRPPKLSERARAKSPRED